MLFSKYHLITSTNKGEKFSLHVANVCYEKWQPNPSCDDMFETILTAKHTDHNSLSIHTQWHTWTDELDEPHSTQGKTCQQVYSRRHRQDIVWLKLCTSISMFIVQQSVWNICTHTAYNVHKTHNKSLSSHHVNSFGGGESPCLSSWSMTLQMRMGIPACARYYWELPVTFGQAAGDSLATSRGCRLPIGRIYHCCASLAQISNHIYRPINHTIKAHTLIKDMQYWQFILVNTLAYSEARFKHSTKYVSSPYHAGSWHCRQQLPWQPDPCARGFDDSSFPGPGKYMNWTHV